jgi:AraC family chitin signaling transcriptional activator
MQYPQRFLRFFLILIFLHTSLQIVGQSHLTSVDSSHLRGIPRVIHYSKKQFEGDPQFWTMCQDKDGILYFGNNDGALIFDGENWKKINF